MGKTVAAIALHPVMHKYSFFRSSRRGSNCMRPHMDFVALAGAMRERFWLRELTGHY
jgi:hypothetical protein